MFYLSAGVATDSSKHGSANDLQGRRKIGSPARSSTLPMTLAERGTRFADERDIDGLLAARAREEGDAGHRPRPLLARRTDRRDLELLECCL
jgi:hypothetical protein